MREPRSVLKDFNFLNETFVINSLPKSKSYSSLRKLSHPIYGKYEAYHSVSVLREPLVIPKKLFEMFF